GEGGTFFVETGGSFTHTAAIQLLGNGIDGCGGELDVTAGRNATLARIDASGGSCGAGAITGNAPRTPPGGPPITAAGTSGISNGGFISLPGRDVVTNEVVRAVGGSQSPGGMIALEGCNVTVSQSSDIRTNGGLGFAGFGNAVRVGGKATINGRLVTT